MHTGKQSKLSAEEKNELKAKMEAERDKYEAENMGKYILLYPLSEKIKTAFKEKQQKEREEKEKEEEEYVPDQSILKEDVEAEEKVRETKRKKSEKKLGKEGKKIKKEDEGKLKIII